MEKEKFKLRNKRGITLVALVITIVVLIILAGVSINAVMNDGLIGNAKEAKNEYDVAKEKEKIAITDLEVQTDFVTKITRGYANKEEGISKYTPYLFRNGYLTGVTVNIGGVAETVKSLQTKLPEGYYVYASGETLTPIDNPDTTPIATGMMLMKGKTEESAQKVGAIIVFGDVNCSGNLDSMGDYTDIMSWLAGEKSINVIAADVNHDRIVNKDDEVEILRYCNGAENIKQDVYALSLDYLILEDVKTIKNNSIEELRKKYTVEFTTWEQTSVAHNAITDTTDSTTVKDILDLLSYDNVAIYRYSTKEMFKKDDVKSSTQLVQQNDVIVLINGESVQDGNIVYDMTRLQIFIVKEK